MKRFLRLSLVVALSCIFTACNMGGNSIPESSSPIIVNRVSEKIENVEPEIIYETKTGSDVTEVEESYYSADFVLKVTPTSNGLLIEKNHPSTWTHNTIHIYNQTTGYENYRVDNVNETTNTILYPFVTKGHTYEIWIEKQETNIKGDWQDWGESKKLTVTAKGGLGNATVYFSKYNYNNSTHVITFKDLVFVRPVASIDFYFDGPLFNDKPWNGPAKYGVQYQQNKSEVTIKDVESISFITNKDNVGIVLNHCFNYDGFIFQKTIVSDVIYSKMVDDSKIIYLEGGKSIPNVYVEGPAKIPEGYVSTTRHFGNDWTDATIRIDDDEYALSVSPVKIKDRGNSTKWTSKVPYSLKFETKTKVLGMSKSKRWVLMANYFDPSLIRTQFASYLGNNVFNSYWNASFKPVNLYINGVFVGTYDLGECNKVEKSRVNIQSIEDYLEKSTEYVDINKDGKVDIQDSGFMLEIDSGNEWAERCHFYSSEYWLPFTLKDPDLGDGSKFNSEQCNEATEYAKSKIDAFEKMLQKNDFEKNYANYIDETSFVDWFLLNEFGKNSDANFQKSVPVVYNAATKKLSMGPNWDFDLSLGNFGHGYITKDGGYDTVDNPSGWYIWGGKKDCNENEIFMEHNGAYVQTFWINRLMESASFRKAVKNRWREKKIYLKNAINEKIVEYANRLYDYMPANEDILPRIGKYEWNAPAGYASRTMYEDEIYYLYVWCMTRYNWMDKQISAF